MKTIEEQVIELLPSERDLEKSGNYYWGGDYEETINLRKSFKKKMTELLTQALQERDRIAYKQGYNAGLSDGTDKPLLAIEHIQEQAREEERERIEKLVLDYVDTDGTPEQQDIITSILHHVNAPTPPTTNK